MQVTVSNYRRFAKLMGASLTLMGASLFGMFALYVSTGTNPIAATAPGFDGVGMLVLASIGAFALPLGLSLFVSDTSTSARLRIAGFALGCMAVLRLVGFLSPEIRAVVGFTPLVEFFVLGSLGMVAYWLRPENESPIDIHMEMELEAPASEAWNVLAEHFGEVSEFASGVQASSLDREVGVGAVRNCEVPGFGPFDPSQITEELTEFDPARMKYAYQAGGELPPMIPGSKNRWSIEELGPNRCRVKSHASVELQWWAFPIASLLGWAIRAEVLRFGEDLRHRVEQGSVHPRKLAALGLT